MTEKESSNVVTPTYRCLAAVADFHRHIGVVPDPASPAQAALRSRLILEEYAETYAALQECDLVEAADGMADLRYVVLGTAVVYGVQLPDDANPEPDRRPVLGAVATLTFGRLPIWQVMRALRDASNTAALSASLAALDNILGVFAFNLGVPLNRVFWEVHRSNMTKTARNAGTGSKYGGVSAKGPSYSPPDIAGALGIEVSR